MIKAVLAFDCEITGSKIHTPLSIASCQEAIKALANNKQRQDWGQVKTEDICALMNALRRLEPNEEINAIFASCLEPDVGHLFQRKDLPKEIFLRDDQGLPLAAVAMANDPEIVKAMLQHPNFPSEGLGTANDWPISDWSGHQSILSHASRAGWGDVVEILLQREDAPNEWFAPNQEGQTLLHTACAGSYAHDVINTLLTHPFFQEAFFVADVDRMTPLEYIIRRNYIYPDQEPLLIQIVKHPTLSEKLFANENLITSILWPACTWGAVDLVTALVSDKRMPPSCFLQSSTGRTVFDQTSFPFSKNTEAIRCALMQCPRVPKAFFLRPPQDLSITPLMWASKQATSETAQLVIKCMQQAGFTLDEFAKLLPWKDPVILKAFQNVFGEQDFATLNACLIKSEREFIDALNLWAKSEATEHAMEAYNRILEAYIKRSPELKLDNLYLNTLPACIGRLTALFSLDLTCNNFSDLPAEIGQLIYLRKLNLSYNNQLTSLPRELGELVNLSVLNLGGNYQLVSLPSTFRHLIKSLPYWCLIEQDPPERFVLVQQQRFAVTSAAYGEVRSKNGLMLKYSYENGVLQVRDAAGNFVPIPFDHDGLKIELQAREGGHDLLVENLKQEIKRWVSPPASVKTDAILGPHTDTLVLSADVDEAIHNPEGLLLALYTEYKGTPFNAFKVGCYGSDIFFTLSILYVQVVKKQLFSESFTLNDAI